MDKKARDDAYDAIPPNTPADMDSFNKIYEETKDFLPTDIQKLVEANDGSFRYLNKEVRPKLSAIITDAYNNNNSLLAEKVRKLRDNITNDQFANLTEHGNEVTIKAAKDANTENLKYVDKYNDGIGKDLRINEKINRPDQQHLLDLEVLLNLKLLLKLQRGI